MFGRRPRDLRAKSSHRVDPNRRRTRRARSTSHSTQTTRANMGSTLLRTHRRPTHPTDSPDKDSRRGVALRRARGAPQRPYSGPLGFLLKQGEACRGKTPFASHARYPSRNRGRGGRSAPCAVRPKPPSVICCTRSQTASYVVFGNGYSTLFIFSRSLLHRDGLR